MTGVLGVQTHELDPSRFSGDQEEVSFLGEIRWRRMNVPCARASGTKDRLRNCAMGARTEKEGELE